MDPFAPLPQVYASLQRRRDAPSVERSSANSASTCQMRPCATWMRHGGRRGTRAARGRPEGGAQSFWNAKTGNQRISLALTTLIWTFILCSNVFSTQIGPWCEPRAKPLKTRPPNHVSLSIADMYGQRTGLCGDFPSSPFPPLKSRRPSGYVLPSQ